MSSYCFLLSYTYFFIVGFYLFHSTIYFAAYSSLNISFIYLRFFFCCFCCFIRSDPGFIRLLLLLLLSLLRYASKSFCPNTIKKKKRAHFCRGVLLCALAWHQVQRGVRRRRYPVPVAIAADGYII